MTEQLHVNVTPLAEVPEGVYVELVGEIGGSTAGIFAEEIDKLVKQGYRRFVLDFNGISYVNSTGLQILIKLSDSVGDDGKMSLLGVSQKVIVVFDALGLQEYFHFSETREASLEFLKS